MIANDASLIVEHVAVRLVAALENLGGCVRDSYVVGAHEAILLVVFEGGRDLRAPVVAVGLDDAAAVYSALLLCAVPLLRTLV